MVKFNVSNRQKQIYKPKNSKYDLQNIVNQARRRGKEGGYDFYRRRPILYGKTLENPFKAISASLDNVALFTVFRTDYPIYDRLAYGDYMAALADLMTDLMDNRYQIKADIWADWKKTGYNKIILEADDLGTIQDLIECCCQENIPYNTIFIESEKGRRDSKRDSLVGISVGPCRRLAINHITKELPIF